MHVGYLLRCSSKAVRLVIGLGIVLVSISAAYAAPTITDMQLNDTGITLTWTDSTNRFIIEKTAILGDWGNSTCCAYSTGTAQNAASVVLGAGEPHTYYRAVFGREVFTVPDDVLMDLITTSISNKLAPSNMVYDSEIAGLKGIWAADMGITTPGSLSDLKSLDVFSSPFGGIESLSGLGGLTNLHRIFLHDNSVSNYSLFTNAPALRTLDLSSNLFSGSLLVNGPSSLRILHLEDNAISKLTVTNVPVLTNLYLWGNLITNVQLSGTAKLTVLDLSHNTLTQVPKVSGLCPATIRLDNNSIAQFSTGCLPVVCRNLSMLDAGLQQLNGILQQTGIVSLAVDGNALTNLPISGHGSLTNVMASWNAFSNTLAISNLPALKNIDLSHNAIDTLSIRSASALQRVQLVGNFLHSITITGPKSFRLNLSASGLTNIPSFTGQAGAAIDYNLSRNLFTGQVTFAATYVSNFNLSTNYLTSLSLTYSTNLAILEVGKNLLTTLTIQGAGKLRIVDASVNSLTNADWLNGHGKLEEAYLRYNLITRAPSLLSSASIQKLDLGYNQITNADSLTGLPALTHLTLSKNELTSLRLTGLKSLKKLYLDRNFVTNIFCSGLKELDKLTLASNSLSQAPMIVLTNSMKTPLSLEMPGNHYSTFAPAQWPTNIVDVDLSANKEDMQSLDMSGVLKITKLELRDCDLTNCDFIVSLGSVTNLDLDNNDLANIMGLAAWTNLTILDLEDNDITDITPLVGMKKMKVLDLQGNSIRDCSVLSNLTSLTDLNLSDNSSLTNISSLAYCTNLLYLDISDTEVTSVVCLASCTNLVSLDIRGNSVKDLALLLAALPHLQVYMDNPAPYLPLPSATNSGFTFPITELRLNNDHLYEIEVVTNYTSLQYLSATDNHITDLTPLSVLPALSEVQMDNNLVYDLSPVALSTSIETVDLSDNRISDLSALATMMQLKTLDVQRNMIQDLAPLIILKLRDGKLEDVDLTGNPLTSTALANQVPVLESLGVDVHFDVPGNND